MVEPLKDPGIVRRLRVVSHILEPAGPEQFAIYLEHLEEQVAAIAKVLGVNRRN